MSQIIIEGDYLSSRGGDLVAKLAEFLNGMERLKMDIKIDGARIIVLPKPEGVKGTRKKGGTKKKPQTKKGEESLEPEKATLSKTKLKVYLKRFLNKQGLDDDLRVLSSGKEKFTFRERQISDEQLAPLEEKK